MKTYICKIFNEYGGASVTISCEDEREITKTVKAEFGETYEVNHWEEVKSDLLD